MSPSLRTTVRSLVTAVLAVVMAGLCVSSARQVPNEFGDTEPGSLLFGVLHLTIAVTAAAATVGLVRRARWASRSVAICGAATVALLVVQPLYTSMEADVQQSIWLGAGLVGVASAGVWWFARRLSRERVHRDARSDGVEADPQRDRERGEH